MSTAAFVLRYALRSLVRSGQRGALAVACVAFGVFSLVGLQLLAASISDAVLVPPRFSLGGDLALSRGAPLSADDLLAVAADPDVDGVDARSEVPARFVQTADNARLFIFNRILAVDADAYPLVGDVRMQSGTLAQALAAPEAVVLSRDLARALAVDEGDRVRLAGTPGGAPTTLTVSGIADQLPDAIGGTLLVGRETARRMAGADVVMTARVATDAPDRVAARFEASGWTVERPDAPPGDVEKVFGFALPAAGLLGLLVGGIGVANTLQVVLTRRRTEVAVLKTLGYRQRDLMALFGVETAILGLVGGVLGVLGGIAGAEGLRRVMANGLPMLLDFRLVPSVLVGGLLAGVATAVLFGLIAIVRASSVRPGTLLRQTPIVMTTRTRLATAGLSLLLFGLFGVLGSGLVGSVAVGFGVIAAGVAGLVVFGALMVAALLVVVRIPTPGLPLVRMAARNLGRHPARAAASLVALFVGTYAIALSGIVILNGQDEVAQRMVDVEGANAALYGISEDAPELVRLSAEAGATLWTDRTAEAEITWPDGTPFAFVDQLHGRGADGASTVAVSDSARGSRGTDWLADPGGLLVPWRLGTNDARPVAVGDTLRVRVGAADRLLAVDGYYDRPDGIPLVQTSGAIVLPATFDALTGDAAVTETVAAEVPTARLDAFATAVGHAHPEGAVITSREVVDMFVRVVRGLFLLVLALTSLALVAGTVLIANGVGLALVERRRELGVLKAVGYSAGQVLRMLLVENALLGLVGGGLGVGAAALTLAVIRAQDDGIPIDLYPGVSLGLVAVAVAIAAASAFAVAWGAVRARPLDVLRAD
ncbi:FtsX-like permease family protein [Rubrivirga sp. IMCC45206]|uniref:FtsX-like permease family protein n=1 Tax=Rubrivirga sp. IMCC45206 TaxID=3391614 RepID=UPI00399019C9